MTVSGAHRRFTAALIDLDDTLYRQDEMPKQVTRNIQDYMVQHLGFEREAAEGKALQLYRDYGTTLAGLVAEGHSINYDAWHSSVHDSLDYDALLPHPDAQLRECLFALELPRHVFTNADQRHARKCLARLGVRDCFHEVVTFETLNAAPQSSADSSHVLCKPNKKAFEAALRAIEARSAAEVVFIDDSRRNIKAAHELGIFTVWVGEPGGDGSVDGADVCVRNVPELMRKMPRLFDNPSVASGAGAEVAQTVEPVAA